MKPTLLIVLLNGIFLCTCCAATSRCGEMPLPDPILGPELTFAPTALPAATVGVPYQATITVHDNNTPVGSLYVAEGELPPGLALTFTDGIDGAEIAGTPEAAGTYTFMVEAWCYGTNVNGDTGTQTYTLVVD